MLVSEAIRIREQAQALLSDEQLAVLSDEMDMLSRLGVRTAPGAISLSETPPEGILGTTMETAARRVLRRCQEADSDR